MVRIAKEAAMAEQEIPAALRAFPLTFAFAGDKIRSIVISSTH